MQANNQNGLRLLLKEAFYFHLPAFWKEFYETIMLTKVWKLKKCNLVKKQVHTWRLECPFRNNFNPIVANGFDSVKIAYAFIPYTMESTHFWRSIKYMHLRFHEIFLWFSYSVDSLCLWFYLLIKVQNANSLGFFYIINPRRKENLPSQ
jgi:hypothetical protein